MSDTPNPTTASTGSTGSTATTDSTAATDVTTTVDDTPWDRLATADPIALRDPLAEVLGMVPEGEPLVFTFPEVAKAAGHACPAVSGAYRATQLALADLYPDELPVRSDIAVTVFGTPDTPGLGPMASVITHITGAADETGFGGFGGYGGRTNLRTFDDETDTGPGRTFAFTRTDTDETVRVTFDPNAVGMTPSPDGDGPAPGGDGGPTPDGEGPEGGPAAMLPKLVAGEASDEERERFLETWHGRVQRILQSDAGREGPFTVERT